VWTRSARNAKDVQSEKEIYGGQSGHQLRIEIEKYDKIKATSRPSRLIRKHAHIYREQANISPAEIGCHQDIFA